MSSAADELRFSEARTEMAFLRRPERAVALALAMVVLSGVVGCVPTPDFEPVRSELAKPVLRIDAFQSVASNGKVVVAGTARGVVVRSDATGANRSRHALAQPSSIVAMTHCPDGSFAALDFYRKVWVSDPDAQRWTGRSIPSRSNLVALTCGPTGRLWLVGSHTTILSTDDGGASWTTHSLGEDAILTTVQFIDDRNGVITGEFGLHLVTSDGGVSWRKRQPIPKEFYPYAALFTDAQKGWISGLAGVVLHTEDGGRTWTEQANDAGAPINALLQVGEEQFGLGAGGQIVTRRDRRWIPVGYAKARPALWAAGAAISELSMVVAGPGGALNVLDVPAPTASGPSKPASPR